VQTRNIVFSLIFLLTLASCGGVQREEVKLEPLFQQNVENTILFEFDKSFLDADARRTLDEQAAFIVQYPTIWFRVEGHADRVGSIEYNRALGLRRANAALDYLVSRGVDPLQLEALVSCGEERPVVDTQSRERRNRRVVTSVGGIIDPVCNCRKRPNLEGTQQVTRRR